MRVRAGGIDLPFWWRPWIGPYEALRGWWYRPRPVKRRDIRKMRALPCPHGRPSWRMCPWCLGINSAAGGE